jgi:hypothetical protein
VSTSYRKSPTKNKFSDSSTGLAVYGGRYFDGTIWEIGGQWTACDADGNKVGTYPSMKAAMRSLYQGSHS